MSHSDRDRDRPASSRYGRLPRHASTVATAAASTTAPTMQRSALETYWPLLVASAVVLFASLVLANAIAFFAQMRRERRIQRKTARLAAVAAASGAARTGASTATAAARASEDAPRQRVVPVTILTGFLGAGKTTLLNRILHTPSLPFKIMVLENELGAISIDHTLLQQQSGADADADAAASKKRQELAADGIYVMQNGCMCCTAKGSKASTSSELERILDYLLRIVDEDGFDYLVVETTGLADPGPIIETFLRLRASRFRLDAVVTMVDAYAAARHWDARAQRYAFPIELERQLLYADIVALNKTDLVDRMELAQLETAIAARNEDAQRHVCVHAELDLEHIIDVQTFDAVKFRHEQHGGGGGPSASHGVHTSGITTVHVEVRGELDIAAFSEWLAAVVDEYAKHDVLRIKGVLAVAGDAHQCVVQCVLDTYTIAPSVEWRRSELRACKLVIIGKHLDRRALEDGFLACLVTSDDTAASKKDV